MVLQNQIHTAFVNIFVDIAIWLQTILKCTKPIPMYTHVPVLIFVLTLHSFSSEIVLAKKSEKRRSKWSYPPYLNHITSPLQSKHILSKSDSLLK